MTDGQTANLIYSLLLLVLVGSALVARAVPIGQTIRMALGWVGIFALLFLLVSFRPELKLIYARMKSELGIGGPAGQQVSGGRLVLRKSDDGHFHVVASVNGREVPFLIDTGATMTALSTSSAARAGVEPDRFGLPAVVETANVAVQAQRATIASLAVGPLKLRDHDVLVADNFGDTNVLGMNFLSQLDNWQVKGDVMVLNPGGTPPPS